MSERAIAWASGQDLTSRTARAVLHSLAQRYEDGGLCLSTMDLCRIAKMDHFSCLSALWFLLNRGLISAEGIGGLMSVTLGCDFDDEPAPVSALPQEQEGFR
ncbi:hypothetical protein [uncultured Roseibium sp.]|uniref:hypothetical protein n=1 Tax=uncultured Roseibium sp. TaxID=1936171 RepID=UPI0026190C92|nr:hypothetical protein [uncultured Roseibium sp.]